MAQPSQASSTTSLELRFKRWTAVAVVCFLGLLAALPFRSAPQPLPSTVAPSHRERSLRFRAESSHDAVSLAPARPRAAPTPPTAPATAKMAAPRVSAASTAPSPARLPAADSTPASSAAASSGEAPTTAVARPGENLMDIAERALGDRRRWRELVELNAQHRSPFDEIAAGEEIRLPAGAPAP